MLNFHKKKKGSWDWHSFIVSLPFNPKHALAWFRHNGTGAPWNWWAHEELDTLQEWRCPLHVVGDWRCICIWRIMHMVVCFWFWLHEQGILRMSAISVVIAILAFTSLSNLLVLNNNAEVPPCSVPWQHGNGHSPNHDQEIHYMLWLTGKYEPKPWMLVEAGWCDWMSLVYSCPEGRFNWFTID